MAIVTPLSRSGRLPPPISTNGRRAASRRVVARGFERAASLLREWRRRRRDRALLASLDDRMLRDIGVSRGEIWEEINKPFWRK